MSKGQGTLGPAFGDEVFGPGQPLDASRHHIILPDSIGTGKSSKPSDGMQTWMWAQKYPGAMDIAVPMASPPTEMSGRNWMLRRRRSDVLLPPRHGDRPEQRRHRRRAGAGPVIHPAGRPGLRHGAGEVCAGAVGETGQRGNMALLTLRRRLLASASR